MTTPHSVIAERDPDIRETNLRDSQRLRRIGAVFETSDKTFDDIAEAASEVGHLVRHTLRFKSAGIGEKFPSPQSLAEHQVTNCYGMTIVASEVLDQLGINHGVSFVNEHAFVTVPSAEGSGVFMVDPPEKDFYLDIEPAIGGKPVQAQLEERGIAYNRLRSDVLLSYTAGRKNRDTMNETHPWLSFSNTLQQHRLSEERLAQDTNLVMVTYPSQLGRRIVEAYSRATVAYINRQFGSAADQIIKMTGSYPELDTRNTQGIARKVAYELVRMGAYDMAHAVMAAVEESLPPELTETNHRYFPADMMRAIGERAHSADILTAAQAAYTEIGGTMGQAKQRKTARIATHVAEEVERRQSQKDSLYSD